MFINLFSVYTISDDFFLTYVELLNIYSTFFGMEFFFQSRIQKKKKKCNVPHFLIYALLTKKI